MSDEYRNALAEGTVLDTYRIERVLGEGGFGVTYLVTELNLGKEYAIKELIPDGVAIRQGGTTVMARSGSMEEDFAATRRHFIKEARVLATLKHPAIVAVHRLFEANGTCYMVMDYVEGETLGAYLKKQGGKLGSRAEFEGIFDPIMDGLELLHGKEMIHRDIKPGNIMVTPDGSPVLLDFGASCRVKNHTVTMTQMLSAGYSPFEQYATRAKQGPYTDIYALGATMVRAITGAKPDDAADRMEEDFYQSLTEQEELVIEYGEQLLLAIDAALLLKKSERPQSIEEWRELIGEEDSEEDPEAQYNLGVMYAKGRGVTKDDAEAVKWLFPLGLLRLFSILDGLSFVILLYFSIYEKRILGNEDAIRTPGMIHGVIFCAFVILLFFSWDKYKWSLERAGLVFVCALIPFAPFFLEPSLKREQNSPS